MESNRIGDHRWIAHGIDTHNRSITSLVVGVRISIVIGLVHLIGAPVLGTQAIPYALVIAGVCIAGPVALWAVPVGTMAADVLIGTPFVWVALTGVEVIGMGLLATILWQRIRLVGVRRPLVVLPLAVSVGLVSTGFAIAIGGFAGIRTATSVYPWLLLERTVLAPALATPVVLLWPGTRWLPDHRPSRPRPVSVVGIIGATWVGFGTLIGMVRRDLTAFSSLESILFGPLPAGEAVATAVILGPVWIAHGLPFLAVVSLLGWWLLLPQLAVNARRRKL